MKPIVGLMLLLTAGCATTDAGRCHGLAYGLNPGHWKPSATDLKPCATRRGGR